MKARVTDIRTHVCDTGQGRTFLFVVVDTDAGVIGVGEASQNDQDAAVVANVAQLAPRYVGRDLLGLVESRGRMLRSNRTGRAIFCAVSAIEQALWDAAGKMLGVPVHALLGGACHDALRCYATMAAGLTDTSPGALALEAKRCIDEGFAGVKVVAGDTALTGVERVRAVREAIGEEAEVLVECAFRFDRTTARRFAWALEQFRCFWLEAPLPWDDATELARLRDVAGIRVASGETLHGRIAYRDMIEKQAVDVLQPDVKWTGGILEAKKISAWAEAYQIAIAPHNNSGAVATAASAQLSATLPNFLILETPSRRPAWEDDLLRGTHVVSQGRVDLAALRDRPGLGIEFDEEVAKRL